MKTIIFDGKAFAKKREEELAKKIVKLKKHPVMATIIVGELPASRLYVDLKRQAAERVGAEMDVYEYHAIISHDELVSRMNHLNKDKTIHGMMIQLPLPETLKDKTHDIIHHIPANRDVDGLRDNSPYVHATARAVLSILAEARKKVKIANDDYVVVIGARGMVGRSVVSELTKMGFEVGTELDEAKNAKVLISATGKPEMIGADNVKNGAIVIDVGSPRGDVDPSASLAASFFTPVPGGVGPVTVVSLLENLAEAASWLGSKRP
jgi:methylenetetrahydrofolate dehydrogenase (NADP+)/methenyltetrahydrofolate cyclohydrolase